MSKPVKLNPVMTVPSAWADSFADEDKEAVARIIEWINASGMSQSWLGRLASVSPTTVSQILGGKYPTAPARQLGLLESAIEVHENRQTAGSIPFVLISIYQMAELLCDRARQNRNFSVFSGNVGVGKTASLKQYQRTHPHTVLIEADPDMTAGVFLDELLDALGVPVPATIAKKFHAAVTALKGTTYVLLIDEAETMSDKSLHYVRRLRDKAGIGIVLAGTDKLQQKIKPKRNQFDQIRSRVGIWPAFIQQATRPDIDAIAQAALADQGELKQDVLDAIWHYCDGSIRMLVENLIPALRDYALPKYAISAEVIDKTAEAVLFMAPRRAAA